MFSLDSTELAVSVALVGAVIGFWIGTKLRFIETGFPGIFAVVFAVLFYWLAKMLVLLALLAAGVLLLVLLVWSWPLIAQGITTFTERLAAMLPTTIRTRSFHKRLKAEQRQLEAELEQTRSLNIDDPEVKRRILEKLQNEARNRMLALADRSKSNRP